MQLINKKPTTFINKVNKKYVTDAFPTKLEHFVNFLD